MNLAARTVGGILTGMTAETECISTYRKSGDGAAVDLMAIEAADLAVSRCIANRPVVVAAVDGIGQRAALTVALNAGVVGAHEVEFVRVDDVCARGIGDVSATGTVALLAAQIPFGDLFCLGVVVDGVTAIAGGAGGAVEVCGTVVGDPSIGAGLNVIGKPPVLLDIPFAGSAK